MVNGLGEWFLPQLCQLCEAPAKSGGFCVDCMAALPWNRTCCPRCALPQSHAALCASCAQRSPPYDQAWCPLRLEMPVQTAIHGLKYRAKFLHAHALGTLMAEQLVRRAAPLPQCLIPVPLHERRLMRRGYNQALELARRMVRQLDIRLSPEAAQRMRQTGDQIGLTAAQRRQNVRGAFRIKADLHGFHVAVLDDVMTTGATLAELARACRLAGATKVEVWAAARAP